MSEKIARFEDLVVWQKSHQMVLEVYRATQGFPKEELFGITSQVRRSAASVPANIAEGFKRRSGKEKVRFYNISEASSEETRYFLYLACDLGYLDDKDYWMNTYDEIAKMLAGLIRSIERH